MPPRWGYRTDEGPCPGVDPRTDVEAFEALRRSLAHGVRGSEGAFAGLTGSTFGRSRRGNGRGTLTAIIVESDIASNA